MKYWCQRCQKFVSPNEVQPLKEVEGLIHIPCMGTIVEKTGGEKMKVKEGDIVTLKVDLYYDEHSGVLGTRDEVGSSWLYLHKGTKMKAIDTGEFEDVEWEGDGHDTTLNQDWVDMAGLKKHEGVTMNIGHELERLALMLTAYIEKLDNGKYEVKSKDNPDWSGGTYDTKEEAEARLKQCEQFSHMEGAMNRLGVTVKHLLVSGRPNAVGEGPVMRYIEKGYRVIIPQMDDPSDVEAFIFPKGTSNDIVKKWFDEHASYYSEEGGMERLFKKEKENIEDFLDVFGGEFEEFEGSMNRIADAYVEKNEKGKYEVKSKDNPDWSGGTYDTQEEADERRKECEMHKHMKESSEINDQVDQWIDKNEGLAPTKKSLTGYKISPEALGEAILMRGIQEGWLLGETGLSKTTALLGIKEGWLLEQYFGSDPYKLGPKKINVPNVAVELTTIGTKLVADEEEPEEELEEEEEPVEEEEEEESGPTSITVTYSGYLQSRRYSRKLYEKMAKKIERVVTDGGYLDVFPDLKLEYGMSAKYQTPYLAVTRIVVKDPAKEGIAEVNKENLLDEICAVMNDWVSVKEVEEKRAGEAYIGFDDEA